MSKATETWPTTGYIFLIEAIFKLPPLVLFFDTPPLAQSLHYQRYCRDNAMTYYLSFTTNGRTLWRGCTPMRIYVDGPMRSSVETYRGCAAYHAATTDPVELLPVSPCPETRSATLILGGGVRLKILHAHGGSSGFKCINIVASPVACVECLQYVLSGYLFISAFRNNVRLLAIAQ